MSEAGFIATTAVYLVCGIKGLTTVYQVDGQQNDIQLSISRNRVAQGVSPVNKMALQPLDKLQRTVNDAGASAAAKIRDGPSMHILIGVFRSDFSTIDNGRFNVVVVHHVSKTISAPAAVTVMCPDGQIKADKVIKYRLSISLKLLS